LIRNWHGLVVGDPRFRRRLRVRMGLLLFRSPRSLPALLVPVSL
jgi:hypothetical protein